MECPPRSSDLTGLDFFSGHLKSRVYEDCIQTLEELQARICAEMRLLPTNVVEPSVQSIYVRRGQY